MSFKHNGYSHSPYPIRFSGVCEDCLFEAWERMTYGGLHIEIIPTRARDENPWGRYRFRDILPLNLVSWDDSASGR